MNAATVLSLVACAVDAVMGGLALALAAAPGWKHYRAFACIAFTAAAYSLGNVAFTVDGTTEGQIVWAARANIFLGFVHCAFWVLFSRKQYGEPVRAKDRWVVVALGVAAAFALIPEAIVPHDIVSQEVPWAGVTYRITRLTPFGSVALLLMPLALMFPAASYVRRALVGAPGASVHVCGFLVFFATVINEILVADHAIENLYLLEVGFLASVVSVAGEMAYRVTGGARRLQELSDDLSRQVEERTGELMQARDRLARAERLTALGRLSASVGHEINNPLSYVMGNLEFLRAELGLTARAREDVADALGEALAGAERIRRIVSELRVFSRGSQQLGGEVLDVREVLHASLKLSRSQVEARAELELDLRPVAPVKADATKLSQVFVNVLVNAAQAIPAERVGSSQAKVTVRSYMRGQGRVMIEVLDTGTGIEEQHYKHLFEPFYTTKSKEGTGLGLFISHGIVTSMGGSIELSNREGRGACMSIELPACYDELPAPVSQTVVAGNATLREKKQRLLIVDDDVLVGRSIARQLRDHEVDVVATGQAAIDKLLRPNAESRYDWVLCDLMMPDMTGVDVYEAVEEHKPHLADRFVFISGGGVTERCRRFLEEHASRVLSKPIELQQLADMLAQRQPLAS